MSKDAPDGELLLRLSDCSTAEKQKIILALYEKYKQLVLKICYYHVADYDRAADLLHDVFVKVMQNVESLRNPELFKAWLMTITRNACMDHLRASSHEYEAETVLPGFKITSESGNEERYIAKMELKKLLDQLIHCVQKLNPRDLIIFKLRWKGLRTREILKTVDSDKAELRRSYDRIKYNLEACMNSNGLSISMDEIMRLAEVDE
jgi:RNA polymerase sigma-70 factor (ECF subfamily)